MTKQMLDTDTLLKRATPITGQEAVEIQPFGHLVRMPIALSERVCQESVTNLNQLLIDFATSTRKIIGRSQAPRSISFICCSISITAVERLGRLNRGTRAVARRRERGDGARRRRDDFDSSRAEGPRGNAGSSVAPAARA